MKAWKGYDDPLEISTFDDTFVAKRDNWTPEEEDKLKAYQIKTE